MALCDAQNVRHNTIRIGSTGTQLPYFPSCKFAVYIFHAYKVIIYIYSIFRLLVVAFQPIYRPIKLYIGSGFIEYVNWIFVDRLIPNWDVMFQTQATVFYQI